MMSGEYPLQQGMAGRLTLGAWSLAAPQQTPFCAVVQPDAGLQISTRRMGRMGTDISHSRRTLGKDGGKDGDGHFP